VREVSAQRDLSYSPVFQSLVVLQNAAREEDLALRGLDLDMVVTSSGTAKFDLSLGMGEYQGRLHASFEYDTDLFDRETVERVRDHFATLLHEVVADPSRRLSELPLLTAEAERDLVTVWNTTDGPVADQPLHALFVDRARVAPDAVAVRVQGAELTYADVDRRSDSLAAHLRAQGVDVGSFVGLCSERSLDMVVGLLAILKAGAACVPLDPAYPRERLRFMVQDTGAAVVLAERGLRELVEDLGVEPLLLDEERPDLEADPVDVDADALAYVIYTSGSTGAPKGVLLDHRGLANHAQAMIRRFGFTDADRVLQFASISFDISLEEIFCTLLSGGTLVLRGEDFPLAGPALLAWLERERITVMDLPTAFWHEWVRDLDEGHMRAHAGLRLVIVGGEKAQAGAYATWRTVADPGVRWVNTYGPTEASVVATAYEPPPAGIDAGRDMPIGRPLDNVRVYVLDSRRRPVPLGVQGELYVAGAGVARGYLHRPEETGARFVALPFNGERAYRTGDVVRQLPSGDLEFLGRTDQQIKLRGYRIEPGEIETMLAEHDLVSTALVMLREDDGREPALVAYVAAERGAADTLDDELRRWLGGRLPGYAVPSAVVVLEEFPLSPNGKVDRAALPAPDAGAPSELARPRDEVETAIAGIWEELLGHPVGIHDNFFEAGGHSLLAVRMFSLLRSRLNVPLPLAVLIQAPTVAELATVVRGDAASDGSHFDLVVPLKEEGARSPLWLIHELRGDLLCYRDLVRRLDDDQPAYGIQAVGLSGEAAPLSRIEDMASRYLEEVRARQPEGPYLFAGLCFGGTIAYEMAHQLEQQGGDVALVGLIDAAPFGLRGRITTSQRSRRHLQELLVLPRGNRLPFLMETSRHLGERVRRHVWWFVSKRLFLDRGRALPGLLHDMLAVNSVAAALYSTPKYGGRVTVFRAQRDDVEYQTDGRLRWADYAGGGVDVRDVASEGVEHLTLLTEPHVERLADALESAIVETLDDEG
jgi:aspartate racemase